MNRKGILLTVEMGKFTHSSHQINPFKIEPNGAQFTVQTEVDLKTNHRPVQRQEVVRNPTFAGISQDYALVRGRKEFEKARSAFVSMRDFRWVSAGPLREAYRGRGWH